MFIAPDPLWWGTNHGQIMSPRTRPTPHTSSSQIGKSFAPFSEDVSPTSCDHSFESSQAGTNTASTSILCQLHCPAQNIFNFLKGYRIQPLQIRRTIFHTKLQEGLNLYLPNKPCTAICAALKCSS